MFNIATSFIGAGERKREQKQAQRDFNLAQAAFRNQDTSNVYANMQNTMEDLTVNTQAADFQAQQQQQALANTMSSMQGAAGGSGIAALAQAMAGQQSQNLQAASASIGKQEAANQMAAARGAANVQSAQIQGAGDARAAEAAKTETLLGMSQNRLTAANEARQAATQDLVGGIGNVVGGAASAAMTGGLGSGAGLGEALKSGFGF